MNKHLLRILVAALLLLWAESALAVERAYAPQTSNAGGVKVTVTLQSFPSDAKTLDFAVTMETHTHPLNDRMENVSVLVADGKQYPPLAWEGSARGGHHRKGMLRFNAISPRPSVVELQISLEGDTAARTFRWPLRLTGSGKGAGYGQ
ncbi:MAG TPA: hypothetical protein VIU46_02600 [Gallionellaceae bacterium]